MYILVF